MCRANDTPVLVQRPAKSTTEQASGGCHNVIALKGFVHFVLENWPESPSWRKKFQSRIQVKRQSLTDVEKDKLMDEHQLGTCPHSNLQPVMMYRRCRFHGLTLGIAQPDTADR